MNLISYFRETRTEMQNVTWPTWRTVAAYTTSVIVVSVLIAYFLGLFDIVFARLLALLIA